MKKLKTALASLTLMLFFLTMIVSCKKKDMTETTKSPTITKSDSETMSRLNNKALTKEQLVDELSKDQDFINLGSNLINFISDIPNQEKFLSGYNEKDFQNGREEYFLNLTGYTNEQVISSLTTIDRNLSSVLKKYPELQYNGTNKDFINTVVDEASARIDLKEVSTQRRNLAACRACAVKWRPRMITATILGAVSGGLLGGNGYSAWAGAVAGFAGAGWGAVDCLEAAGC